MTETAKKGTWGGYREGGGRPAKGYTATLYARVTEDFADAVKRKAEEEKISVGEYVMRHLQ